MNFGRTTEHRGKCSVFIGFSRFLWDVAGLIIMFSIVLNYLSGQSITLTLFVNTLIIYSEYVLNCIKLFKWSIYNTNAIG